MGPSVHPTFILNQQLLFDFGLSPSAYLFLNSDILVGILLTFVMAGSTVMSFIFHGRMHVVDCSFGSVSLLVRHLRTLASRQQF